jgi:large subunit ribosomal protein L32e
MNTKQLLELRTKRKKSKPHFVERESKLYARIKSRWRLPRGTSSPIRRRWRGEPAMVTIGHRSPREVRGLHSSGLEKVVVNNAAELLKVNPSKQGAVIASTVGNRKRAELLKLAHEKKIRVLNIRDTDKKIKQIDEALSLRKKSKQEKLKIKDKKQEEKRKKAEEKEKKKAESKDKKTETAEDSSDAIAEKTVQEQQKEEVDKLLIKNQ